MAIISPTTDIVRDTPEVSVYTRARWSDEWTSRPDIYAARVTFSAGPEIGDAILYRDYGRQHKRAASDFTVDAPLRIERQYIRISISGNANDLGEWVGIVWEVTDMARGDHFGAGNARSAQGRQTFKCVGIEALLAQAVINRAWIPGAVTAKPDKPDGYELPYALNFNTTEGRDRIGNRDFPDTTTLEGFTWTGRDILDYLISDNNFTENGVDIFDIDHGETAAAGADKDARWLAYSNALTQAEPSIRAEGRDVFSVINEVCDRRRLFGCNWVYDPNGNKVRLRVFTYSDLDIDATDNGTPDVTRNPPYQYDFATAFDVAPTIEFNAASVYSRVIVRGGYKTGTATFRVQDPDSYSAESDYIQPAWDEDLPDDYFDSGNTAGLAGNDKYQERARARADPRFDILYTLYEIKPTWDGRATPSSVVVPSTDVNGNPDPNTPSIFHFRRLQFLPFTALDAAINYEWDGNGDPPTGSRANAEEGQTRLLPPTVWVPNLEIDIDDVDEDENTTEELPGYLPGYIAADVGAPGFTEGLQRTWTVDFVADGTGRPYFRYLVSGAPRHVLAPEDDASPGLEPFEDIPNVLRCSWHRLSFTGTITTGERIEIQYPPNWTPGNPWASAPASTLTAEASSTLYIDMPWCRWDWLAADTTVRVNENRELVTNAQGRLIRDDRDEMRRVARLAFEYYSRMRRRLSLELKQIADEFPIGRMVGRIRRGAAWVEVYSVVTSVEFNWVGESVTTRVYTDFGNLDAAAFRGGA